MAYLLYRQSMFYRNLQTAIIEELNHLDFATQAIAPDTEELGYSMINPVLQAGAGFVKIIAHRKYRNRDQYFFHYSGGLRNPYSDAWIFASTTPGLSSHFDSYYANRQRMTSILWQAQEPRQGSLAPATKTLVDATTPIVEAHARDGYLVLIGLSRDNIDGFHKFMEVCESSVDRIWGEDNS